MTDLIAQQREREREMVQRGVSRFYRQVELASQSGRHYDLAPYSTVLTEMVTKITPAIEQMQDHLELRMEEVMRRGGQRQSVDLHLVSLDATVTAYIVVRTLLQMSGCTHHTLAARVAGVLQMQRQFDLMKQEDNQRIERLKRKVKHINPSTVRKWMKTLEGITKVEWTWEDRVKIGMNIIGIVVPHLSDYIDINTVRKVSARRTQFTTEVCFNETLKARLREQTELLANESPWLTPMICPPKQFTQMDDGGYYEIDHDLVKDNYYGVRVDKSVTVPQAVCDAVNTLGNVKWRINEHVLQIANQAIEQSCEEILPVAPTRPLPEPIEDAVWAVMSKEQRAQHKVQRRLIHDHNNKLESKRETMRRVLQVAEEYKGFDAIYFPHNLDFRGRAYPLPQDLNPQGDDFSRSLLEFGEGKPVDHEAYRWLCHACAASYGEDKLSLEGQYEWCENSLAQIYAVAADPLGTGYEFLCGADEPWQFLAACIDIIRYWNATDDGGVYISHLPVHIDGTCNGLQHLSAMGLDPVGAKAVNLMDGPRQDIYQQVADKINKAIGDHRMRSALGELGPQFCWTSDKVTRKTVKRGVMTTPYGVTPEGIRRQLIDDGMLEGVPGDQLENATYMRDRMVSAIDDTIVGGKVIMAWMQNVAKQLCAENKPVTWVTPIGFVCSQAYRKPNIRKLQTLVGRTQVIEPNSNGELRASKQINSIAPNIVHSFDAAHLMMTVNLAHENGLAVGTVHDSYGTHACDVPTLGRILKSTFIDIYCVDQLDNLKNSFVHSAGRYEEWMEPPARGEFNIGEVMESTYFFF